MNCILFAKMDIKFSLKKIKTAKKTCKNVCPEKGNHEIM